MYDWQKKVVAEQMKLYLNRKKEKPVEKPDFEPRYVFVYGTLKRGHHNHHVLGHSEFAGDGELYGSFFDMYDGGFPYLIHRPEGSRGGFVTGEIYYVTDKNVMDALDRLEGVPHLYRRIEAKAFLRAERLDHEQRFSAGSEKVEVYVASEETAIYLREREPMKPIFGYLSWPYNEMAAEEEELVDNF